MESTLTRLAGATAALAALAGALFLYTGHPVRGSDHQDSPLVVNRPGADITDVYVFPASNPANVDLIMDVHPLIPAGQGANTFFDPGVLYQFKIDNNGDKREDLAIQFLASGTGRSQVIKMFGPAHPYIVGSQSTILAKTGAFTYNTTGIFGGIKVFAGPRQDPFFFDLAQFFKIIPDRFYAYHPPFGSGVPAPSASSFRGFTAAFNTAHGTSCNTSAASDYLSSNKFNVLSFIVELPRTALESGHPLGKISVWATTSVLYPDEAAFTQVERLARPAVKEAFEAFERHDITNHAEPWADPILPSDIYSFMTGVAGRSPAIASTMVKVLIPDEIVADLSKPGPAAYLGVETGGATGGLFGGRGLSNDVIDISLGAIFGNTIPLLSLAPDDHHESLCLTTDNVGTAGHTFISFFPYNGAPF